MNGIVRLEPEGISPLWKARSESLYRLTYNQRVSFVPGVPPGWWLPLCLHIEYALKFESFTYLQHCYAYLLYHTGKMKDLEARYLLRMLGKIISMELESLRQKSLKTPA